MMSSALRMAGWRMKIKNSSTMAENHWTKCISVEGVSNTITVTQLRFPRFSQTSLLGKQGQICFADFLKVISSFFAQNCCTERVDILLCSERNKMGGFPQNLALLPLRTRSDPLLATNTTTTPTTPSVEK